jgi:hypothetical protein
LASLVIKRRALLADKIHSIQRVAVIDAIVDLGYPVVIPVVAD